MILIYASSTLFAQENIILYVLRMLNRLTAVRSPELKKRMGHKSSDKNSLRNYSPSIRLASNLL